MRFLQRSPFLHNLGALTIETFSYIPQRMHLQHMAWWKSCLKQRIVHILFPVQAAEFSCVKPLALNAAAIRPFLAEPRSTLRMSQPAVPVSALRPFRTTLEHPNSLRGSWVNPVAVCVLASGSVTAVRRRIPLGCRRGSMDGCGRMLRLCS